MSTTNLSEIKGEGGHPPLNLLQLIGQESTRKHLVALAGAYFTADRLMALLTNAVRKTPRLLECDPQGVLGCMMAATALGLEVNTPAEQAFLVPYAKREREGNQWVTVGYECELIIGYRGFITLAYRSPLVESVEAEPIHDRDHFDHLQGSKAHLEFRKVLKNRGELIGAYCLIKLKSGGEIAVTLPLDEIHKVRDVSEGYKSAQRAIEWAKSTEEKKEALRRLDDTPWVKWEDSMAAKTALRALVGKRLPLNSNDPMSIAARLDGNPTVDYRSITRAALNPTTKEEEKLAEEVFKEGFEPPLLTEEEPNRLDIPVARPRPEPVRAAGKGTPRSRPAPTSAIPAEPAPDPAAPIPPQDGPTEADALAAVERGDYDVALDLANLLDADVIARIKAAIDTHRAGPAQGSLS